MTPTSSGGGIDVVFPNAGVGTSREIWQETFIKFSSNWKTDFGGSGNPDHKTILWFDRDSDVRWSFHIGNYGHDMNVFTSYDDTQPRMKNPPGPPDLPNEVWDGEWHSLRFHFDMGMQGQPNAVIEMWLDGVLYFQSFSLRTYNIASHYFNKTALGRNLNQLPDQNQTVWYGRTRVWISDPGWN
jgi:hypothetical protein